jgi:uncharacterized repeat protein (TIGR01451 family)
LTFPPAGTTASSSASGAGILGGERDMQINLTAGVIAGNTETAVVSSGFFSYSQDATIAGNGVLQWDGNDGSATLNTTGLGGIDLTSGGTQDAFLLNVFFDDLPVNSVITVYTDAGNASSVTVALPGLVFSATNFAIPYSSFTTTLGAGADFTNVGAITLSVGSTVTAPDLVIDFFQTTSLVNATKTVAIQNDVNGNGMADPGDTLRYTVIISNPDDGNNASETGVVFSNPTPANTTLVNGSVTTTQGTVTTGNVGGDLSVGVNVGTLADGGTATVTFDVTINNPLPAGVTQITCQGTVTAPSLPTGVPTDDPTPPGTMDPTVIPVSAAPAVTALKTVVLFVDVNGNAQANPGDTLKYTIVINNTGNQDASGVMYTNAAPANTTLVVGSVTTTQGTVTTGNTAGNTSVLVNVGTIPGGGSVTIMFQAKIDDPLPPGVTQITCQGTVTGTNIPSTPTDNPGTGTPNDPTTIPVTLPPAPVPTLNEWGLLALLVLLMACALVTLRRQRRRGDLSA